MWARVAVSLCLPVVMLSAARHAGAQSARATPAARSLPGHVVDVKAGEFFFQAPDTIPDGLTTFRLLQTGLVVDRLRAGARGRELVADKGDNTRGAHMLWVVRLDSGKTLSDLYRAAHAGERRTPWARQLGGPGFILPPSTTNATLDLEPGNYALVCYTGSAREDRTRYHLMNGMFRALTVVTSPRTRSRGKGMAADLFGIWTELGSAQRDRFTDAGCDIMAVLGQVEDGLVEHALVGEVLEKLVDRRAGKPGCGRAAARSKVSPVRRATRTALCFLAAATLLSSGMTRTLEAQVGAPRNTAPAIDATAKAVLVNALADTLVNGYIYEKTGRIMADSLRAELRSGVFDGISDGGSLARRVTQTLRRLSNDRHLGVSYAATASGTAQPARRMVRVPPGTAAVAAPAAIAPLPPGTFAAPDYGIARAELLADNVGYLNLSSFSGGPDAISAVDSAMAVLASAKALVIDLGSNRGGGPEVIRYLSAYLFDKPTHLVSSFSRGMDAPMERWTAERVAGKRLPDIPVYILTSGNTISAAESFTFGLRVNNRATVVGEPTAGGGHFGGFVALTPGFTVFLPRGRTYDPRTGEGWEAEGLRPDVEAPYARALSTALQLIQGNRRPLATAPLVTPSSQQPTEPGSLRAEIDSLHAAMVAAFNRDPATVAQYYADDASILGGGRRWVGRGQIDGYWTQIQTGSTWSLDVLEVGGGLESPWVRGRSTLVGQAGRRMVTDYVGILKRQPDRSLKFYIDMFVGAPSASR